MIHAQGLQYHVIVSQQSATNAATITSGNIDTLGFDYLTLPIFSSTSDAATDKPTVLKLQEADVTNTSSFADVVAFTGGTSVDSTHGYTIPNAATATADSPYVEFCVDLRPRKRYLRLLISPVTTQSYSALAILSRPEQLPTTLTTKNVAGALVVG